MFGMAETYCEGSGEWGVVLSGEPLRTTPHSPLPRSHLARPYRIPNDVVHRKLDELGPLLPPALALGPHVDEPPLDVGDLAGAELVFQIEMLGNQRFDPAADRGAIGFTRRPIDALLRPRVGFQPEHFPDELRTDAVPAAQLLHHVELD